MSKDMIEFDDVLKELGINEAELNRCIAIGEIRAFRSGDTLKFRRADLPMIAEYAAGERKVKPFIPRPGGNPVTGSLQEDYEKVTVMLEGLLKDGGNRKVASASYLEPSVELTRNLPLTDMSGEFQYYLRIRDALRFALDGKKVPRKLIPGQIPDYLDELVE